MLKSPSSHTVAVLLALFVTVLWSSSWVLIKIGLADIPAVTFAGLRYSLAFLILLPFILRRGHLATFGGLSKGGWVRLIVLGLLFYTVAQGAQFLGLFYLPAITVSLMLNFTPVLVTLMSILMLAENPGLRKLSGVALSVAGALFYFYPLALQGGQVLGLVIASVCVLANAVSSVLGRQVNRAGIAGPLTITVISMGVGSLTLLGLGISIEGLPRLSLSRWVIILWLAVANTALAFTLWNHTLRTLSAVESSVIANTMMIQIAILAWVFLGERITLQQGAGLVLAGFGALIVQLRRVEVGVNNKYIR